eukprot:2345015-Rhodomonas_salina.1
MQIAARVDQIERDRPRPFLKEYPLSELEAWTSHLDLFSRRTIHSLCLSDQSLVNIICSDINSAREMSATGRKIQARKQLLRIARPSRQSALAPPEPDVQRATMPASQSQ